MDEEQSQVGVVPAPQASKSTAGRLPHSLRTYLLLPVGLIAGFIAAGPWALAGRSITRLTPVLGASLIFLLLALLYSPWRQVLGNRLLERRYRLGWRTSVIFFASASALLLRVVMSKYYALEVNAWDFSVYELPVVATLRGEFLASPFHGTSYLGVHASYLMLLFVPLYALWRVHYWLLVAQALAVAGAGVLAFAVCRRILRDDLAGLLVGVGFVLNSYTAKVLQYVFHIEVFYPCCLLLTAFAFLRRRRALFLVAVLLTVLVKEDAVLILAGCAITGWFFWRPRSWWLAAGIAGIAAFGIGTFVIMPRFAATAPGQPWYSPLWAAYGPTPLRAAVGMVCHPFDLARDVARSGVKDILETLGFLPLIGYQWFLAALPALTVYAASGGGRGGVAHFSLYYSSPVLPLLVVAAAEGLRRLSAIVGPAGGRRRWIRLGALSLCLLSALDGASYTIYRSNPTRLDLATLTLPVGGEPFLVQGSLLPHMPLVANIAPLVSLNIHQIPSGGVLLAPASDPYPFKREELSHFAEALAQAGFEIARTPHGLFLAKVARRQGPSVKERRAIEPRAHAPATLAVR